MPESSPHVLIIMADQLRYDVLGRGFTPYIDALLNDSCVFERGYCSSPLCVPARGAFFTGRYPNQTGCLINGWAPADASFGRVCAGIDNLYTLANGRWDVWHTGKQHLHTEDSLQERVPGVHWLPLSGGYAEHLKARGQRKPGGRAFSDFVPEVVSDSSSVVRRYSIPTTGQYPGPIDCFFDGYITDCSLRAIEDRDPSRPFWLNAMFVAPHPPLEIPEPWYSRLSADDIDLPENVGEWYEGQSPLQLYHLPGYLGGRYSREQWREVWRVYCGLVALLDDCVGRILTSLRKRGMEDDTLILFTADHGEMLGSHRLWQKMCHYEESIRVPIAWRLPAGCRPSAVRLLEPVSHIDVLPTLCDLLGLTPPPDLPGRSLRHAIERGREPERRPVFCQYDGNGAYGTFSRCVVDGDLKLNVDLFKNELFLELYDVAADPQERRNRVDERPGEAQRLLELLRDHMGTTGDRLAFEGRDAAGTLERLTAEPSVGA